jgi:hypothetical protein
MISIWPTMLIDCGPGRISSVMVLRDNGVTYLSISAELVLLIGSLNLSPGFTWSAMV